jgi:hypothetical protein
MEEKIKVGKIKNALKENEELTKSETEYSYYDREKSWAVYDSSPESFGKSFLATLPKDYLPNETRLHPNNYFTDYIKDTLSLKNDHDLNAVEFGGPGSRLFLGFSSGFFKQTVGICLQDVRNEYQQAKDNLRHHSIIEGNILDVQDDKLLDNIKQKLGVEKIDLIISRMAGPLLEINKNGAIMDRIIRNWYEILNENGLMFVQFDYSENDIFIISPFIEKWVEAIKNKFPEIDIQTGDGSLRLYKRAGSPEELPSVPQLFK